MPHFALSDTPGVSRSAAPAARQPAVGRIGTQRILRLQRAAGNRAVGRALQRRIDATVTPPVARFRIGPAPPPLNPKETRLKSPLSEIRPEFARLAWALTADGVLDDGDIQQLFALARLGDDSVDDNERMFMAALLDAHNVEHLHDEFHASFLHGEIAFPVSSITAANRARIRDFGRAASAEGERLLKMRTGSPRDAAARKALLTQVIVEAAGAYAGTARAALTQADTSGVRYDDIYRAMIAAASDSTPGDRAFAALTFVIASRAGLVVAADLLVGRMKVDEVDPSVLLRIGENVGAFYMPAAGQNPYVTEYGLKGDTLHLASTLDASDVFDQSMVVHELTHAGEDRAATKPRNAPRPDAEVEAFIANTAYQLRELDKLAGAERQRALANVAAHSGEAELMCLYYNARAAPDAATSARWTKLADDIQQQAPEKLQADAFLDQFGHSLDLQGLHDEAEASVRRRYSLGPFAKDTYRYGGFTGESALD